METKEEQRLEMKSFQFQKKNVKTLVNSRCCKINVFNFVRISSNFYSLLDFLP